VPTRDISVEDLKTQDIWTLGPSSLRDPQYAFKSFDPVEHDPQDSCLEEFKTEVYLTLPLEPYQCVLLSADKMSVGTVYDGFAKLLKVVGHLVKWKRLRDDPQLPMTILLRASQYASFPAELAQVLETKTVSKGPLAKYSPFLDDRGILRVNSRLSREERLSFDERFPVILSCRQSIGRLLVKSFPWKYKHPVGSALMLAKIQKGYVILGISRFLAKITGSCLPCRSGSHLLGEKYRKLERSAADLWEQFLEEVLLDARSREKWRNPVDNLRQGDVVLILRKNPLEDGWEIVIIEEVTTGSDNQVRSALVRTKKGVVRRAALHLVLLPGEDRTDEIVSILLFYPFLMF
jgi:hypothetical protein